MPGLNCDGQHHDCDVLLGSRLPVFDWFTTSGSALFSQCLNRIEKRGTAKP